MLMGFVLDDRGDFSGSDSSDYDLENEMEIKAPLICKRGSKMGEMKSKIGRFSKHKSKAK